MQFVKLLQDRVEDERGKARLKSLAKTRTGDKLNTVPVRALGPGSSLWQTSTGWGGSVP